MRVCLDASLVAAVVLPEGDASTLAKDLMRQWVAGGVEFIAPELWAYEAVSVVYKAVLRGRLPLPDGPAMLSELLRFRITLLRPPRYERAYAIAMMLGLPAPYDAHYLAIAEAEGCEFWTGDRKLYERVHATLPWVHVLGE
jgi:predicted nucleic acid-binding protein